MPRNRPNDRINLLQIPILLALIVSHRWDDLQSASDQRSNNMNSASKKRHYPHGMLGVVFLSLLLILLMGNVQTAVADSFTVSSTMTNTPTAELVLVQVGNPFTGTLTPTHFAYHFR